MVAGRDEPVSGADDTDARVAVTIEMQIGGRPFRANVKVPAGRVRPSRLLPLFHALADVFVQAAVDRSAALGRPVTCRQGCAACCRHFVPVSEIEVRRLAELIGRMPDEQRARVLGRLEAGRAALRESGLLERVERFDDLWADDLVAFVRDYFRLWIDCPFLEDESCLVHADRPAACREHLAVSPAVHCSDPAEANVEGLPISTRSVSTALRCFNGTGGLGRKGWRPLIVALPWAIANPEEAATGTGPELLAMFCERVAEQDDAGEPGTAATPPDR